MAKKWYTIAEAVKATGKGDRTLRRWVASNKLPNKRQGRRLFVDLSGVDLVTDIDSDIVIDIDTDQVTIARLEAELAGMGREVDRLAAEVDYLRQAHAVALSKIPAIEATTGEQAPKPDPPRRWWQVWK